MVLEHLSKSPERQVGVEASTGVFSGKEEMEGGLRFRKGWGPGPGWRRGPSQGADSAGELALKASRALLMVPLALGCQAHLGQLGCCSRQGELQGALLVPWSH